VHPGRAALPVLSVLSEAQAYGANYCSKGRLDILADAHVRRLSAMVFAFAFSFALKYEANLTTG
jgi:hypothetical protein